MEGSTTRGGPDRSPAPAGADGHGQLVAGLFLALAVLVGLLAGIVIDRTLLTPPIAAVAAGTGIAAADTPVTDTAEAGEGATPAARTDTAPGTATPADTAPRRAAAPGARPAWPRAGLPSPPGGRGEDLAGGRVLRWMGDSLGLSAAQKERIAAVVREEQLQARQLTTRIRPRYQAIVRRTRVRILAILTPEQRLRLRRLLRERRRPAARRDRGPSR
jgi:Spy/CpxP family protein refolding chaperone